MRTPIIFLSLSMVICTAYRGIVYGKVTEMDCKKARIRVAIRGNCEIAPGEEPQQCYNLCSFAPIEMKDCKKKINSHCCVYEEKCIIKGGVKKLIPTNFTTTAKTTAPLPTTTIPTTTKHKPSCKKVKLRLKNAQCMPHNEDDIQDCYDLCTKKPVDPKDCTLAKNFHCCLHNCRCIIKGAGTEEGKLPPKMQLESQKKKSMYKPKLLPGCKPKTKPKTPAKKKIKNTKPGKKIKKGKKKPSSKKTKKPKKSKKNKKPKLKPTTKKTKKLKTTPTPATKTTKCAVKSTTAKPFSLKFFSRLSFFLTKLGAETEVVPRDC